MDGSTLVGTRSGQDDRTQPNVPCLTIAYHPNIHRVGEQLRMAECLLGQSVEVSRLIPTWKTPAGRTTRGLNDPYLSRKPLRFSGHADGICIDPVETSTPIKVDGELIRQATTFSGHALQNGVMIEFGDRVVAVLHWAYGQADRGETLGLLGVSAAIATVRQEIRRVGPEPVPVLLRGLSGTGKELVAKALHEQSTRSKRRFVAVNMGAVPETTAASELFGHVKGAFTGATANHPGYFGQADQGTLFLDEIGEIPTSVQPIMLRALESGEVQPLGSQRPRSVDVRIVAATDANLEQAIEQDSFRVALLHRLAGYEIHVPPLRARREDVGLLFMHFFKAEVERIGMGDRLRPDATDKHLWLPASLVARLVSYNWPGNVRQLRNVARQLAIASKGEASVMINVAVSRLLPEAGALAAAVSPAPAMRSSPEQAQRGKRANLDDIDDTLLVDTLRANQWKIAATARALSVSKNSLYQLMERCTLIKKAKDLSRAEIEAVGATCEGNTAQMAITLEVSQRGLKLRMTELGMT